MEGTSACITAVTTMRISERGSASSRERSMRTWTSRVRSFVGMAFASAVLGAPCNAVADERLLYKSVLPNGRVVYGDAPAPNAKRSEEIFVERHAPNPEDAQAAQRALAMTRQQLLRDATARTARLKQLDNQIADTYGQLKDAESRREMGTEVQEGDRQGRRLASRYSQRQRVLEGAVERARQQLDRLVRERAALQY